MRLSVPQLLSSLLSTLLWSDNFFFHASSTDILPSPSIAIPRTTATYYEYLTTLDQTDKMRAARYYGKEDVRIEHDVAAPPEQLLEGQVRVQPAFVGICGTGMQDHCCRWMRALRASKY
jgi:hypothetical protein